MALARFTAFARPAAVLVALAALTACSSGSSPEDGDGATAADTADTADDSAAQAEGDFCEQYADAGGTLATPGLFQVGMPPENTIDDLSQRVAALEGATPPDDIAAQWQTLHDLYTEAIGIAEQTPADGAVVDPRVFEIVDELDAPSEAVRDYLDANC